MDVRPANYDASNFLTRFCSGNDNVDMPRRPRLRLRDLLLAKWRLPALPERTFPFAVILQRFAVALCVFFLGIGNPVAARIVSDRTCCYFFDVHPIRTVSLTRPMPQRRSHSFDPLFAS